MLPESQLSILNIIPKVTGTLSMAGSSLLGYVIITKTKQSWKSPYHRLLLVLSFFDFITSFWFALGLIPVPQYTNQVGAKGNDATCQAQGFFLTIGSFVNQFYAVSLMIYFNLTICDNMSPEKFHNTWEVPLHLVSLAVALILSILAIQPFEVLNWTGSSICWLAASPPGCEADAQTECIRGSHLSAYLWGAIVTPMIICVLIFTFSICRISFFVRRTSKRSVRTSATNANRKLQRQVSIQCILYGLAFLNTYWLIAIATAIVASGRYDLNDDIFALLVLVQVFYPLQGVFNFLIFIRPRYARVRRAIKLMVATSTKEEEDDDEGKEQQQQQQEQDQEQSYSKTSKKIKSSSRFGCCSGGTTTTNTISTPCSSCWTTFNLTLLRHEDELAHFEEAAAAQQRKMKQQQQQQLQHQQQQQQQQLQLKRNSNINNQELK